jgi:hypothetical protein
VEQLLVLVVDQLVKVLQEGLHLLLLYCCLLHCYL